MTSRHKPLTRRALFGLLTVSGLALSSLSPMPGHAAPAPIVVGVVVDFTGSAGLYGIPVSDGLQLAADQINATGGIDGHPIVLRVHDGQSNLDQVSRIYTQYAADPLVVALIGPILSVEAFKANPIAQKAGLPVIGPLNAAPGITGVGDYIFRVALGDDALIPIAFHRATTKLHLRKVAIIYGSNDPYTQGSGTTFQGEAARLGLTVVDTETFTTGTHDFRAMLGRIKAAQPDAILVGALYGDAVRILRQGRGLGIPSSVHFIGGTSLNTPNLLAAAGPAAEGLITGAQWSEDKPSTLNIHFVGSFGAEFLREPDRAAAQAYDALNILAAALKKAHTTTDRAAVRDALATISGVPVVTGGGVFSFTADREANETGQAQIVQDGRFVTF